MCIRDRSGASRLYGKGQFFYYVQEKYGANAVLALSLSRNETKNGTSNLAIIQYKRFEKTLSGLKHPERVKIIKDRLTREQLRAFFGSA